jgi:hypothetical protein
MAGTIRPKAQLDALFVTDGSRSNSGQMAKDAIASIMGCYGSISRTDFGDEVGLGNSTIGIAAFTGANAINGVTADAALGTLVVPAGGGGDYVIGFNGTVMAVNATPGAERGDVLIVTLKNLSPISSAVQNHLTHRTARLRTTVDATSAASQPVLSVAKTDEFAVDDFITIDRGGGSAETHQIATIQAGVSLTLTQNLAAERQVSEVVEGRPIGSRTTEVRTYSHLFTATLADADVISLGWALAAPEALIGVKHALSLFIARRG